VILCLRDRYFRLKLKERDYEDAVLAAQAGVRKSWGRDFSVYTENNIEATQVLLEACATLTLERVVPDHFEAALKKLEEAGCTVTRAPGEVTATLEKLWDKIKGRIKAGHVAALSGASGVVAPTAAERVFLEAHPDLAVRAIGSYLGHGVEPQFVMNVALAAIALDHGSLFPPCDSTGLEKPMTGDLQQVVVTAVGHWRGEGLALVERVG
jgi:hypothetical protein